MTTEEYQFSLGNEPGILTLEVLSPREGEWHTYRINDTFCSCPARVECYHLDILKDSGGYAGVITQLAQERCATLNKEAVNATDEDRERIPGTESVGR